MTRDRLIAAASTAAILAGALMIWLWLPSLIAAAGLQRYGLLLRVILIFAALSLADRLLARLTARQPRDHADDH